MPAKFEVYVDQGGKSRWRLKAANGEKIASSGESFSSKSSAETAAGTSRPTRAARPARSRRGLHLPNARGGALSRICSTSPAPTSAFGHLSYRPPRANARLTISASRSPG
jgi:uncharacterized protein YegP (UPF0339 family)